MKKSYSLYNSGLINAEANNINDSLINNHNENMNISPSKEVINNILNYSKALNMIKVKTIGHAGLIMN